MIGLLAGACLFFVLGAASGSQGQAGRYQIACPDSQNRCFVIDTIAGRVWQRYAKSSGQGYGSPADWNKKPVNKIEVPTGLR